MHFTDGPRSGPPRRCAGFTATELLIAFVSVLVLVLLATTVWQTQTIHRHVQTAWREAQPVLAATAEAFERLGEPPVDRRDAGLAPDPALAGGRYVEGVEVTHGRVDIRFGRRAHASIAGRVLRLTPYRSAEEGLVWRCRTPESDNELSPLVAAGEPAHLDEPIAPLQPRHHPAQCR